MHCTVRKDLKEQGLYPSLWDSRLVPLINVPSWFDINGIYECYQPDIIDDEEANIIIISKDKEIMLGSSIDFEFLNDKIEFNPEL